MSNATGETEKQAKPCWRAHATIQTTCDSHETTTGDHRRYLFDAALKTGDVVGEGVLSLHEPLPIHFERFQIHSNRA